MSTEIDGSIDSHVKNIHTDGQGKSEKNKVPIQD